MSFRVFLLVLSLAAPASLAQAQGAVALLTEVAKDSVRFEVRLEFPATVELEYGEELFAWEGRAESLEIVDRHELNLSKLVPNREYFYRLLVDGMETGEILTFRTGRSWIDHRASILVTADTPSGSASEQALAERMFSEQANAYIVLGGDGGNPDGFQALHGRARGERLVLETGGTGDSEALRSVAISDVAIGAVSENPLLLADGSPAPAAGWLATALPALEGACWSVVASARELVPNTPEAAAHLAWAKTAGVQVLLTRSPEASLVEKDGVAWLALPDPAGDASAAIGRLESDAETLTVKLESASGELLAQSSLVRRCPIPASLLNQADEYGDDDEDMFGGGSSDADGGAEDCDY
jgi:hypothetical protein